VGLLTDSMKEELRKICGRLFFDEPMSRYTTLRVGGEADLLAYPQNVEEVTGLVLFAKRRKLPCLALGAGSNLIVRDKGLRGIVLCLVEGFNSFKWEGPTGLYAEAGVGMPRLVEVAAEGGREGLEGLVGVPGNLGGALMMNAGTREGEIGAVVHSVTFVDRDGRLLTWPKEKIGFAYRESGFPKGTVILSARLDLTPSSPEKVREKIDRLREKRIKTQPLNVPNVGSIFKNPKGGYAAAYIEEAGLKDVRVGKARISPRHANFIVNEGGATAREILSLIGLVKDKVKEKFGVSLELEAKVVGED